MSDDGVRVDMPHIVKRFQSTANVERLAIKSNHSSFNYNQIYLRILLLNTNEKINLYVTGIYIYGLFICGKGEFLNWLRYNS